MTVWQTTKLVGWCHCIVVGWCADWRICDFHCQSGI